MCAEMTSCFTAKSCNFEQASGVRLGRAAQSGTSIWLAIRFLEQVVKKTILAYAQDPFRRADRPTSAPKGPK